MRGTLCVSSLGESYCLFCVGLTPVVGLLDGYFLGCYLPFCLLPSSSPVQLTKNIPSFQ